MKLLLTSFGISNKNYAQPSIFQNMPPLRVIENYLMPDYFMLLLYDQVIVDKATLEAIEMEEESHLTSNIESDEYLSIDQEHREMFLVATIQLRELFRLLITEGFVKVLDYREILESQGNLIQKMLEIDLIAFDSWLLPLRDSLSQWHKIAQRIYGSNAHTISDSLRFKLASYIHSSHEMTTITRIRIEKWLSQNRGELLDEDRNWLITVLSDYLSSVNSNLVLSNLLGVGFHDWADFEPFYRRKFLSIGKETFNDELSQTQMVKLWKVLFPDFQIKDPSTFMRILTDNRIENLRRFIDASVEQKTEFDTEFVRRTLLDVLKHEQEVARYRSVASWITKPLDIIPSVGSLASTAAEEIIGLTIEHKLRNSYQWFYLLSDVASP